MTMQKPFAITLDPGSSLANKTGSWRTERPVYVDRLPPCNGECPAGEDIQGWLFHAESGDYEVAWRHLTRDNPLPAIMGRVCYHTCESVCNRAKLDSAVGINSVERFLGDEALKRGWAFKAPAEETGKHVLVVGAGPSGMSAAYHLRRRGHRVTIREAGPVAGGMMRFGIPKYRLPRDVLDAEVKRILDMGVTVKLGTKGRGNGREPWRKGRYDAAFLAVGAHIAKRAFIPAKDSVRILDAVAVLRSMEGEQPPMLGRRVVVYGGGNTAIDVARTAKRLGATDAIIVYRRTRERMPAHDFEVEEALEEGVTVKWLTTITEAGGPDAHHREDGTRRPRPPAADRRIRDAGGGFAGSGARSGGRSVAAGQRRGHRRSGRRRDDRSRNADDQPPRPLLRRRHVARRTERDGGHRPGEARGAAHRRLAARRDARARSRTSRWPNSTASTPGTTPTRRYRSKPDSSSRAACRASTRCRPGSRRIPRCSRRAAA